MIPSPRVLINTLIEEIALGIATAVFYGIVLIIGKFFGRRIFAALSNLIGLHSTQVAISVLTIGAGVLAFRFKKRNQSLYGLVEVVFGATSGIAVAFTISLRSSSLTQWATLIGCAYVMARGFSNYDDAKGRRAKSAAHG